jgi:phage-related minor tail protein
MAKQNELNLVRLTGDEYQIALKEQLLSLDKEELAMFDEERFKIEFNNKLRIDGLLKQKEITQEITNMMAQDMGNAIKGLIKGTSTLNDFLGQTLNKMIDGFLNLGIFGNFGGTFERGSGLLGSIFRANGGPVKGGSSYIVGERGPELFTPGVSGKITPNEAMGGPTNIVVNVDASGTSVQSDGDGQQFGEALATAIQLEIVKQKRSGGLLA